MLKDCILIVLHNNPRRSILGIMLELRRRGQLPDWDVLVETVLEMMKAGEIKRSNGYMNTFVYSLAE